MECDDDMDRDRVEILFLNESEKLSGEHCALTAAALIDPI